MIEESTQSSKDLFKNATGLSIGLALVMIVLGIVAIVMPLPAGLGISVFFGWIIVFGGLLYLAYAFAADGFGSFIGRTLIGIVYIIGGGYLAFNPLLALATLTFIVAVILIAEGAMQMIGYFQVRSTPGSGWMLFDGIVTLGLGILIAYPWPGSSGWAVGTLVGVNLLFSGFTRLMYSITAQKLVRAAS